MQNILDLQTAASKLPQVEYPVYHHHSENSYIREFHMPANHFVIGKEHRTRHLNILVKGTCTVWTVHGQHRLCADNGPVTFESMAGVKKVVYAHSDIIWMTFHPTDETDQNRLEQDLIKPAEQMNLFPELDKLFLIEDKQS